jgi:hypothetical protein
MGWERAVKDLVAIVVLSLAVLATAPAATATPSRECRVVQGRYAIYVNHDRLWVVGSRHLLDVSIPELDRDLEARGWEDTMVYGDFTLCAAHMGNPINLTTRDPVEVKSYDHLIYGPRR